MSKYEMPGGYEYQKDLYLNKKTFPKENVDLVASYEMLEGDVAVVTYPKAGTTWLQEIIYQIYTGVNTDSDESKVDIHIRVPFMEAHLPPFHPGMKAIEALPRPHLLKSHLYASSFEKQLQAAKGKFIIVMRNVKDSLVSYFSFYALMKSFGFQDRGWEDFFQEVRDKKLLHGDWLDFNLSWWELRNHPNVMILKYEDLKRDPAAIIRDICRFVKKPLTDEQLERLVDHTSFSSMKDNPAVNFSKMPPHLFNKKCSFMRQGQVGSWDGAFTAEQTEFLEENYVKEAEKYGLTFDYK